MFGNLRFIAMFENNLLLNQVDLLAHCSYNFSTSKVLRLRCNNTLISTDKISSLANVMENPLFKIAFLNDQTTHVICPSYFWLSHV